MPHLRLSSRWIPWLLAVVVLAAQALTIAHEQQHDLHLHDDASCVLHLHAKHAGHTTAAVAPIVVALASTIMPSPESDPIATAPVLGYRTRAPPLSSGRSI